MEPSKFAWDGAGEIPGTLREQDQNSRALTIPLERIVKSIAGFKRAFLASRRR
jgi:hypothetical protein